MKFNSLSSVAILSFSLFLSANIYSVWAEEPKLISLFFSGYDQSAQLSKASVVSVVTPPSPLLNKSAVLYVPSIDASSTAMSLDTLTVSKGIYSGPSLDGASTKSGLMSALPTIIDGSWQGNVISAKYGGTGVSNYSKGDILYADASGDLVKLPSFGSSGTGLNAGTPFVVPAGSVLAMSGDGLPYWGSIATGPQGPQGERGPGGGSAPGFYFVGSNDTRIYPSGTNGSSGGTLSVYGDLTVNNSSNATFSAGIQATKLNLTSTTATTTLSTGGFTIGTNQLVVQQNSGNIGIGSTSPFAKIGIVANADSTGRLISMSNSSGAEKLVIQDRGWIGIGTSTPSAKISISGDGTGTGRLISLADSNNAEKLTIFDNGSVGIGTTTPSASISIQVGAAGRGLAFSYGSTERIAFVETGVAGLLRVKSGSYVVHEGVTDGGVVFPASILGVSGISSQDATNFFWDNTNKRLGVGTSSPYARLSVVGETVSSYFTATSTTATTTLSTGGLNIGSGQLVVQQNSGRVGVGTSTPSQLVDIYGNLRVGTAGLAQNALFVDSSANRIGLGTSTPTHTLTIQGNATAPNEAGIMIRNSDYETLFSITAKAGSSGGLFKMNYGPDTLVKIGVDEASYFNGGNVGIGTSSPWRAFSAVGTLGLSSTLANSGPSSDTLCVNTTTFEVFRVSGACTGSSERFKENIEPYASGGISLVKNLRPVSYNYKNDTSRQHLGFIAEEVNRLEPRIVQFERDGITPRGVLYDEVTAVLTKAIQEQQTQIDSLNMAISATGNWNLGTNGVLTITEIKTDKFCIGSTCIDESTLRAILKSSGVETSTNSHSSAPVIAPELDAPATPTDTEAPVVSLVGESIITLKIGDSFVDPGATVTDNVNNNLGIQTVGAEIDTSVAGVHTITYNAVDSTGNKAPEISRTVAVE